MKPRKELVLLDAHSHEFPPIEDALEDPNGLLAIGGDLHPDRLLEAYRCGIFPWFEEHQPIMWWSPNPRAVLKPENLRITRSLRKSMRNRGYRITTDQVFEAVITQCQSIKRNYEGGTWITSQMVEAYTELHRQGFAHSVECWKDDELVGGLYGISIGSLFFGESMFSSATDASKMAFVYLTENLSAAGFPLIDCQIPNAHLTSLGASLIPREAFQCYLDQYREIMPDENPWQKTWTTQES